MSTKNDLLASLDAFAKECGIKKNTESNGGIQIYRKEFFDGLTAKQVKSQRKKLRDNYVIPLLESIVACKNKDDFKKKHKSFCEMYKKLFINETFDFSVFGMLRNNNAVLAENAEKVWNNLSK